MISPAGARTLNTALCECLCTKTASGPQKNVRVNRRRAQSPPVCTPQPTSPHRGVEDTERAAAD